MDVCLTPDSVSTMAAILVGPDTDMLLLIFEHLPLDVLGQAARTCAHWRDEYRHVTPRDSTHRLVIKPGTCTRCQPRVSYSCTHDGPCSRAAGLGSPVGTLEYLRAHGCPWDARTVTAAAAGGHLEVVQHLLAHMCPGGSNTYGSEYLDAHEAAAAGGHVEVIRAIHEHERQPWDAEWDSGILVEAAGGGHLAVIKYLYAEDRCRRWTCRGLILQRAVASGHIGLVQYLRGRGYGPWKGRHLVGAARRGDLGMVQYLLDHGCPCLPGTIEAAAIDRRLDVVRCLYEAGCSWIGASPSDSDEDSNAGYDESDEDCADVVGESGEALCVAAESGDLVTVKALCTYGCPWFDGAFEAAVDAGRLGVVQYLHEYLMQSSEGLEDPRDACRDIDPCTTAAAHGYLGILKYLVAQEYPVAALTMNVAVYNGRLEVVKYLHGTYSPGEPDLWDERTFDLAVWFNNPRLVQYLIDCGCPQDATTYSLYAAGDRDGVVEHLCAKKCPNGLWYGGCYAVEPWG